MQDILDTEKCISVFSELKKCKDNFEILSYIKKMSKETIIQFENFSKMFPSIIELEINDDISENIYEQVNKIIKQAIFNILQDSENLLYYDKNKEKLENISLEELIHLKNRISIKNENENKKEKEDDKLKSKYKILLFFKNIISNLEIIIEYMNVLRIKGSSLPIKISIKIKIEDNKPSAIYYLGDGLTDFKNIRDFLFNAKTKYISQLDSLYKEKLNLRFLYGKQFRSIIKHLESNLNIDSFLRYIINNTDDEPIKEGYKTIVRNVNSYIKQYELYNKNSLESNFNICDFFISK